MINYVSEHLKNKLEDYRYATNEIELCQQRMEEIDVMRGVKAIRYDKVAVQGSSDPLMMELNKLELVEQYNFWEKRKEKAEAIIDEINMILDNIDKKFREAVFKIHCLKVSTYEEECSKLGWHEKTLQRKVNRELSNFYNNVLQDTLKS